MANKTIRIKKRHNDQAEVRSYVFDVVKARGEGLKFEFINSEGDVIDTMTVPHEELDRGYVTARGIKSKVNAGQVFDLVSFKWESDTDRAYREAGMKQLTIFDIIPECNADEPLPPRQ